MDELINGYRHFRSKLWTAERQKFEELASKGQKPHTMAIACSDSRVAPELIFDCAPGDIFTVRNIANLVPPYAPDRNNHGVSAAIEFAVRVLGVKRIAIVGHSKCGGIQALVKGGAPEGSDFIGNWVGIAEPARRRVMAAFPDDLQAACDACETEAVRVSLANLMGFPFVAEAVESRGLLLLGFFFSIGNGQLYRILPDGVELIEEKDRAA